VTRWTIPFLLSLLVLFAACEEDEESYSRKLCDPMAYQVSPSAGTTDGGYEITLYGRFLNSSYSDFGTLDTAVHVGGIPAEVLDVDTDGCNPCDACIADSEACIECLDVCDGTEAFDGSQEECIEQIVIEAPAAEPGTARIALFNAHGATDEFEFIYLGWCEDDVDNDGDGLVDVHDPGCAATGGVAEEGPCEDGLDNDGDGWIDMDDPGCAGLETGSTEVAISGTQCNNGIDDDGDGNIDSADPDCEDGYDTDEFTELGPCEDTIDNDADGWTDYEDPDCGEFYDELGWGRTECNDGEDNDLDGFIDSEDAECEDADDILEEH